MPRSGHKNSICLLPESLANWLAVQKVEMKADHSAQQRAAYLAVPKGVWWADHLVHQTVDPTAAQSVRHLVVQTVRTKVGSMAVQSV